MSAFGSARLDHNPLFSWLLWLFDWLVHFLSFLQPPAPSCSLLLSSVWLLFSLLLYRLCAYLVSGKQFVAGIAKEAISDWNSNTHMPQTDKSIPFPGWLVVAQQKKLQNKLKVNWVRSGRVYPGNIFCLCMAVVYHLITKCNSLLQITNTAAHTVLELSLFWLGNLMQIHKS